MEKLCYVLWKPPALGGDAFRDRLLADVAPALLAGCARRLSLLVADAEAEAVAKARLTRMAEPLAGMLSVWVDDVAGHGAVEAALAPHVARTAGYLVSESVPLPPSSVSLPAPPLIVSLPARPSSALLPSLPVIVFASSLPAPERSALPACSRISTLEVSV